MKLLIISDLHIGNGGRMNTFGWRPERFIKTLEKQKRKYEIDKVILNGDIFDLYQHKFDEVKTQNAQLVDYLGSKDFIYIRGNHDFFNTFARESYQIVNRQGKIIHIEHGHKADFINGTRIGRSLGRILFELLKFFTRFKYILNIFYNVVERIDEIDRIPKKYNSYKYLNYALKLLKNYDVVVLGHTHKIETHKTYYLSSKKRYLNTGACSMGRFQGIVLDTESLKYETIKINKEKNKLPDPSDAEKTPGKKSQPKISRLKKELVSRYNFFA